MRSPAVRRSSMDSSRADIAHTSAPPSERAIAHVGGPPSVAPMRNSQLGPLSPLSFLDRAARSHGDRLAVIDADMRLTYAQLRDRCQRLGGALASLGQQPVAVLAPNSHVLLEAHFGVPWAGVPLVTINTRLSADEVAYIVAHCEAGVLIYDAGLEPTARAGA